jgi:hypothetical protein
MHRPKLHHALIAAAVLALGLVQLTTLTWAQLGHYALLGLTVASGLVLVAYLLSYARQITAWLNLKESA